MHWTVDQADRLDRFLTQSAAGELSRAKIQTLVSEGRVTVNGKKATKPAQSLHPGDEVMLDLPEAPGDTRVDPRDLGLTVLYEDDHCLVINKPAGLPVHPGTGMAPDAPTILHGALWLLQERGLPLNEGHCLVHRLDQDTTGCMLIAKDERAHRELQSQFAQRRTTKHYLAIVAGVLGVDRAVIDSPIGRHPHDRTRMSVLGATRSREAQTTIRVLGRGKDLTLLDCELHTGRTHQARVHLHAVGHPILGDMQYKHPQSEILARDMEVPRLCLHAWTLHFTPPGASAAVTVRAPVPEDFADVLTRANLTVPKDPAKD